MKQQQTAGRSSPTTTSISSAKASTPGSTTSSARTRSRSTASPGVHFAVWAPNAAARQRRRRLQRLGRPRSTRCGRSAPSGVWEIFVPRRDDGQRYKFEIRTRHGGTALKADPFGFAFELPPALRVDRLRSAATSGTDDEWMTQRAARGLVVRQADGDLRGASRLVGAGARRRRSLPHLRGARRRA